MSGIWVSLVPLIIGSALVPIQIVITTLLLRSSSGRVAAVAWVAGMTTVRLAQGLVFGLIFGSSGGAGSSSGGQGAGVYLLLLAVSILFYVAALKQLFHQPDEDAPPPKWMAKIDGATPGRAYLLGVGLLAIGAKVWVFTLAAVAVIADAGMGPGASTVTFLVFVILAESIHLALLGIAYTAPDRSAVVLDRVAGFLRDRNRVLVIGLGAIFGTWFLVKALSGLGVI